MSLTWKTLNINDKNLHLTVMILLWELYEQTAKFLGIRLNIFG
jgi:hypothetical protein